MHYASFAHFYFHPVSVTWTFSDPLKVRFSQKGEICLTLDITELFKCISTGVVISVTTKSSNTPVDLFTIPMLEELFGHISGKTIDYFVSADPEDVAILAKIIREFKSARRSDNDS